MKKPVTFLLITVLCITVFSLFGYGFLSIATPFLAVGSFLMLSLCSYVDRENIIGSILLFVYFAVLYFVFIFLLRSGFRESGMVFLEWLLTRGDEAVSQTRYLIVLGLSCVTFFGITVYYFTLVRYRINILTLVSMMPCVLYVKVVAEVDDTYLVPVALLNVLAAVYHYRNENEPSDRQAAEIRPLMKNAVIFTLTVTFIGALIPRGDEAKYYDRFEDLFLMRGQKDVEGEADLSFLNDVSGDADGYRTQNPRRLFILKGDLPPYLKRHNFDYYDYESDHWYKEKDLEGFMSSLSYPESPQLEAQEGRLMEALLLADSLSPGLLSKYGLDSGAMAAEFEGINDDLCNLLIYPVDFKPEYYLGASRQVSLFGAKSPDRQYSIYYFTDRLMGLGTAEKRLAQIDLDTSEKLLKEAAQVLLENVGDSSYTAARRCLDYFYARTSEAIVYRDFMEEENKKIPDTVRDLALDIVKDCEYDWQKASALQTFFHAQDFVYDLDYDAPDDSVEYFLNVCRTGTCSDFAGAYVLMARACGLSVRYAEGFKAETSSRDEYYYIRETGSHAYPEVFVPLVGWCVFEPTVSAEEKPGFFERLGLDIHMDFGLIYTVVWAAAIIAAAGIVIKLFMPLISEVFFLLTQAFTPASRKALRRYRRTVKKLSQRSQEHPESLTPRELVCWYEKRWPKRKRRLASLKSLVEKLEKDLYR